jgi:hypothetical protein
VSNSTSVRLKGRDSGMPHRVLEVRVRSDTSFQTPVRAFDPRLVSKLGFPREKAPLYEAYSRLSRTGTKARISDKSEELAHTYRLNALRSVVVNQPFILFQDYFETSFPSEAELEYITRTEHSYSDFVLPPLVSRFTDSMNAKAGFEHYVEFLKGAMQLIDTFNHKPVMGVIPLRTPFTRIGDLVEFYVDRGVTALCLDFAANKPDTALQSVEQVLFSLAERGVLDSTYVHAINVSPGRPRTQTNVATCHNILSFGYGMDSFGDIHRTRMAIGNPPPTPVVIYPRLFNSKDYGDYLIRTRRDASSFRTPKSSLPAESCLGDRDAAKLFNSETQSAEAAKTARLILSSTDLSRVSPYLGSKAFVPKEHIQSSVTLGQQLAQKARR